MCFGSIYNMAINYYFPRKPTFLIPKTTKAGRTWKKKENDRGVKLCEATYQDKSGNHADPRTLRPLKLAAVQTNGSNLYILPNNTTLRALYKHMGSKDRCRDRSFRKNAKYKNIRNLRTPFYTDFSPGSTSLTLLSLPLWININNNMIILLDKLSPPMTKSIQLPSAFHNQVSGETLNRAFKMDNKVFQQLGQVMIHKVDHGTQLKS